MPRVSRSCRTAPSCCLTSTPGRAASSTGNVFDSYEDHGEEVSFISNLGHFVVMAGDAFGTMTDLGEPGIQDFAVLIGAQLRVDGRRPVPVALLALRPPRERHAQRGQRPELPHSASGEAARLDRRRARLSRRSRTGDGAGERQAGLRLPLYAHEGTDGTVDVPQIRCFDVLRNLLQPTDASDGIPPGLGWKELGLAGDTDSIALGIWPPSMRRRQRCASRLRGSDGGPDQLGAHERCTSPNIPRSGDRNSMPSPASRAIGLLTADLNTRPGESYREEIILSTLGGHVVWFHLEDMLANGSNPYLELVSQPMPNPLPDGWHSNRTLAGQWGFLAHDAGQGLSSSGRTNRESSSRRIRSRVRGLARRL